MIIAIFLILTVGPTTIARSRQLFIERLEKMAGGLRQEDDETKANMHPNVRRVMQEKTDRTYQGLGSRAGF